MPYFVFVCGPAKMEGSGINIKNSRCTTAFIPARSQHSSVAFLAKKKQQVLFPATREQNIAHVNLFCKPSKPLILMAINVLIAICLIHLLW